MLAHFRTLSLRSARSQCLPRPTHSIRLLSQTSPRIAEEVKEDADEDEVGLEDTAAEATAGGDQYEKWLEKSGFQFKNHDIPRNWLGGDRPFPLNPTFKPPTPVSDKLRNTIYEKFMVDPAQNSVRALSERYGLSIKRVDAILRLKGLEASMKQGQSLQTGFLKGMEKILGVTTQPRASLSEGAEQLGEDATQADYLDEVEGNNEARHRYQRMFWEPVVEGQEPVLPEELRSARSHAEKFTLAAEIAKSDPKLLGVRGKAGSHDSVHAVERPNRTTLEFVDVGGKFLDVQDRTRRIKEGERRSKLREKRRLKSEDWRSSQLTH